MSLHYISLGSNMGDRAAYLQAGVDGLRTKGIGIDAISAVYETEPWGKTDQAAFLNAVIRVNTDLSPRDLLTLMLATETAAERVRDERWGPRTLDLDLIYSDGVACDSSYLTLPHPYFWERAFVLVPLRDVAPHFSYRGQNIEERIAELGTNDIRKTDIILR